MDQSDKFGFSPKVMMTAVVVLESLRIQGPATRKKLAEFAGVSSVTIYRALKFLIRELGAPITAPARASERWDLVNRKWRLPLFELRAEGWVPVPRDTRGGAR